MVVGDFSKEADLVVIGSGPGGYVAAIRAAQLGRKVTIIEKGAIGGVCLNVGCIPSKAIINAAHHYSSCLHDDLFGVTNRETTIDFSKTQAWKNEAVVNKLTSGIAFLIKKNKVEVINGEARFVAPNTLHIMDDTQMGVTLQFKSCVVATGSRPIEITSLPFKGRVIDSTGALNLPEIPKKIVVIGGGYIGMELASAYAHFGSEVTILEGLDRVLAGFEADLVKPVVRELEKIGTKIITKAKATGAKSTDNSVLVTYESNGQNYEIEADYCLVAVGRRPNTDDIGFEMVGVELDEKGIVKVDETGQSSTPGIWAIGDIVAGPPLAHKASFEAKVAVAAACGDTSRVNDYLAIPTVCFTSPEIAVVGITKEQAKAQGMEVTLASFPYGANGRSLSMSNTTGQVRLVAEKTSGRLIGAQVVGPQASELIATLTLAVENLLTVQDIDLTIHNHPSLAEMIMDAAEGALGHPIHQ